MDPSKLPSMLLSKDPSKMPSMNPTKLPSIHPSKVLSKLPSKDPSKIPSLRPSKLPSINPSKLLSMSPSKDPSKLPPCCSQTFKYCDVTWCGDTESSCTSCLSSDVVWLVNPPTECSARWTGCNDQACCNGLTCVFQNPSYSQCEYV
mmetsp:Transcript_28093/g.43406  ORF Transcript_28093/g.43406 Transcript_28093/m.43406 type:complete len:147 (+) Transcript_28093:3-443(+)